MDAGGRGIRLPSAYGSPSGLGRRHRHVVRTFGAVAALPRAATAARAEQEPGMCTHVHGLTVTMLADAFLAARTVEHPVTLVDDATHTVVVIDQRGRVTPRADQGRPPRAVAAPDPLTT
jgi:hypothetical protein